MLHVVVYYPKLDMSKVEDFRKKYDPYTNLVRAHITFVFPLPEDKIPKQVLVDHLSAIARKWKPFDIRMTDLSRSWEHWLFLDVEKGNQEIINLHDELYTGPLAPYLRIDLPYDPHIGLGLFTDKSVEFSVRNPEAAPLDSSGFEKARKEAELLGLDYSGRVESLHLITIDDKLENIVESQEFMLGS